MHCMCHRKVIYASRYSVYQSLVSLALTVIGEATVSLAVMSMWMTADRV